MRIDGTQRYGNVGSSGRASSREGKSGFDLSLGSTPSEAHAAGPAAPTIGLESLIALQFVEGGSERRKRGFKRGRSMLDALDQLKVSLLGGAVPADELTRLLSAVGGRERDSEDPRLEGLLDEIELRARVELAKLKVHHRLT